MVKINLLIFLFLIQFLLLFIVLTLMYYRRYNRQRINAIVAEGGAKRLNAEIAVKDEEQNKKLSSLKEEFTNVQNQFEQVMQVNAKLKALIDSLIPQAERTREHESVIKDIEQYYVELDSFVRALRGEKRQLLAKVEEDEKSIAKMSARIKEMVSKEDHDYIKAQNHRYELDIDKLKDELSKVEVSYSELEKNYMWLEKEYNALYENLGEST